MADHKATNDEIVDAWIDYTERCRPIDGQVTTLPEDDPAWWAIDILMEFEFSNPLRALEIAFAIARKSSDEWVLENLGAGPLETLLGRDPTFLDAIKLEAASSPGLFEALGSVWKNAMPDDTWVALQSMVRR